MLTRCIYIIVLSLPWLLVSHTTMAGFKIEKRVKDVSVEGQSAQAAINQITTVAPKTENANHTGKWQGWLVQWHYGVKSSSLACSVNPTSVMIQAITEMPVLHWKGYDTAPPEEQRVWDEYQSQINTYQQGKIDLTIEAAKQVDIAFSRLGNQANCGMLHDAAKRKADRIIERAKKAQTEYDKKTRFGNL